MAALRRRDDYGLNKQLRRRLRATRKEDEARDERRRQLGLPEHVKLLPASQGDELHAAAQTYGGDFSGTWRRSRRQIAKESIFSGPAVAAARQQARPPAPAAAGGSGKRARTRQRLETNVKLRLSEPK